MLTSRADNDRSRLASCALAQLYDAWQQVRNEPFKGETNEALAAE